jgi:hypothetical protein
MRPGTKGRFSYHAGVSVIFALLAMAKSEKWPGVVQPWSVQTAAMLVF